MADQGEAARLLRLAYSNSLQRAQDTGNDTVAFPAISCGVYGYPVEEAAFNAINTCLHDYGMLSRIDFCLPDQTVFVTFLEMARHLLKLQGIILWGLEPFPFWREHAL